MTMDRKLLAILVVNAILFGLSKGREIDMVFKNSKGKEIKLGEIRLEESKKEPGCCRDNPAASCLSIKQSGSDKGNGLYWINAGGQTFQAYCDMTSFGGGWIMCYSTNDKVKPKTETTYNPNAPYPSNGYRTDCNNIPFDGIMFVDEETKKKAYFKRQSSGKIKAASSYSQGANSFGLWESKSLATTSYKYQLLICDTSFYSGYMISGYTSCWKKCNHWCNDYKSPYFRTSSTSSRYRGCSFNINGASNKPTKLISVGLR